LTAQRLSRRLPALARLLEDWPPNPVLELNKGLKEDVATAIKARWVPGSHPNEDRGEIATVFYAAARQEEGESFAVVTDDAYGKTLVRDRDLPLVTTAELVLEMVQADALSRTDGKRVWRQCVSKRRWPDFDVALAQREAST
jgi:hypothetical protein